MIPRSSYKYTRPVGIGKRLRTKVNASIGTSTDMLWEKQFLLAIDPETARLVRADRTPSDAEACTMCGDYCALKIIKESIDLAR